MQVLMQPMITIASMTMAAPTTHQSGSVQLISKSGCRLQELKNFLRNHTPLDDLWKVAHGEIKYADFKSSHATQQQSQAPPAPKRDVPEPKRDVKVPEELVSICLIAACCICLGCLSVILRSSGTECPVQALRLHNLSALKMV